jgi:hypothetical protein
MYNRISMGHHSLCMTSEGVFLQIECVKIRTVLQNAKKGDFIRSKIVEHQFLVKFRMSPLKLNYKNEKILTGTDDTALSKKKLFRTELVHRFEFTPFYGTKVFPVCHVCPEIFYVQKFCLLKHETSPLL